MTGVGDVSPSRQGRRELLAKTFNLCLPLLGATVFNEPKIVVLPPFPIGEVQEKLVQKQGLTITLPFYSVCILYF